MSFLEQYEAIPPADVQQRIQLVSGWIRTDARAFFAELRDRRPVFRTPAFTLVTRFNDVVSVLQRNQQFSVRIYGLKMDDVVGPFMLGRDESLQNYRDKSLMRVMMPFADLEQVRAIVNETTNALLPDGDAEFDVVKSVSRHVPVGICGRCFGFPGPNTDSMLRWSKATQADFFKNITNDAEVHAAAKAAGVEMKSYIAKLVQERMETIKAKPNFVASNVVDRLVNEFVVGHLPLEHAELVTNIAGLLIGTVETTSQAVAQALKQILVRPAILQKAISLAESKNHEALGRIVREALRFDPINPLLFRYTEVPSILAEGTSYAEPVPQGTIVFACTSSAMWDRNVIENPDDFAVDRPEHNYLHFGHGSHECLGKYIGDVMTTEIIRVLLLRGATQLAGAAGDIDFEGGPFPESYRVHLTAKQCVSSSV